MYHIIKVQKPFARLYSYITNGVSWRYFTICLFFYYADKISLNIRRFYKKLYVYFYVSYNNVIYWNVSITNSEKSKEKFTDFGYILL